LKLLIFFIYSGNTYVHVHYTAAGGVSQCGGGAIEKRLAMEVLKV